MENKQKYFFCYSKHVANYVKSKGIRHITVAQDPVTLKIFSLFEITPELQTTIDEYKNQKIK